MSNASSPPPPAGLPATRAPTADPPAVRDPAVRDPAVRETAVRETAVRDPAVRDPARGTRVAVRPPTVGEYLHLHRFRVDGWTPVKVAAFIEVLGETGSVTRAAAYVSMTTASAYRLRNRPGAEPFAEAWEAAIGTRHEKLADLAMERIQSGVERGRWWRGEHVGSERVFSDRLLMFMLTATSPDRARRGGAPGTRADPPAVPPPVPGDVLGLLAGGAAGRGPGDRDGAAPGTAGCTGDCPEGTCPACDTPPPSATALYDAALAEETALLPDVEATMAAERDRRAGAKAADEAQIAAIGAALDAALGRTPAGEI